MFGSIVSGFAFSAYKSLKVKIRSWWLGEYSLVNIAWSSKGWRGKGLGFRLLGFRVCGFGVGVWGLC